MLSLGIAGGLDPVHEQRLDSPENYTYDGAAVLVEDGVVLTAIEEERLDRIKHSNKFPLRAIEHCLQQRGVGPGDLDRIAYYVDETTADGLLRRMSLLRPDMPPGLNARTLMRLTLSRGLGCEIDADKLRFFEHKLTHAACAMHQSGLEQALVAVLDNAGGMYVGRRDEAGCVAMETLAETTPSQSLQRLCSLVLPFLGLGMFEEHKAIALATAGDAKRFAELVGDLYDLQPEGSYRLRPERAAALLEAVRPPAPDAEPSSEHADLAAALQGAMEEIVLHMLAHYRRATGLDSLCLAGGMAENTSTNGRILYSGLFDTVFVHPAAYDSGCAIGAALLASQDAGKPSPRRRVETLRWGSDLAAGEALETEMQRWTELIDAAPQADVAARASELLADGLLLAWVQGRSDFGSHALGARNVFGDPRDAETGRRVHRALGRRETYRPLAVMIPEEALDEWCAVPPGTGALPFQSIAARVREAKRPAIAAAMQADGCARVQSVSRQRTPEVWNLLRAFEQRTGSAALVTASFNNRSEPAVESVENAVASFLSSGLDALVVGHVLARKRSVDWSAWTTLQISLPPYVRLVRTKGWLERQQGEPSDELRTSFSPGIRKPISRPLGDLLFDLDGATTLADLLRGASLQAAAERELTEEVLELWSARLVVLRPGERVAEA